MTKYLVVVSLCGLMSMAAARGVNGEQGQGQPGQGEKPAQKQPRGVEEMAAAMAKARRFTQPGEAHKTLGRFVGKWNTEMRIFMAGKPTPAEKGTAEFTWQMPGRWLKQDFTGAIMGQPMNDVRADWLR